jgi:hypothetical protein
MMLFRDVVCQVVGKGQGCSLISATIVKGNVPQAKGGGGAPVQNVTNSSAPWAGQQKYLTNVFTRAQAQSNIPQTFFPNQTYASFSPQTEQALNLTEQRALAGSPVQNAANQQLQATLNGDFLHGGAGFNAALDAARNRILPDIQSRYSRGGRYGSGLGREAEARALADSFAAQYGNERENQLRAMFFAPQAAASDYRDMNALAGVGAQREGQAQSSIDEAMSRHNFGQQEPVDRLRQYRELIDGNFGNQQQSQTTGFRGNRGAGILGGALAGGQLAGLMGLAPHAATAATATAPAMAAMGLGPIGGLIGLGGLLGGLF